MSRAEHGHFGESFVHRFDGAWLLGTVLSEQVVVLHQCDGKLQEIACAVLGAVVQLESRRDLLLKRRVVAFQFDHRQSRIAIVIEAREGGHGDRQRSEDRADRRREVAHGHRMIGNAISQRP